MLAASCAGQSTVVAEPASALAPVAPPTENPTPRATELPAPTDPPVEPTVASAPDPTATPTAAPPSPTATVEPVETDNTPVVVQGDGWAVTQSKIEELTRFTEEAHELEFTGEVRVVVSEDIGVEFAAGFEPLTNDDWYLMRGLGLADQQADRLAANQVRLDRIRGACCQFDDLLQVAVEVQPTQLGTEAIIVHELTHALHVQHRALFDRDPPPTDETPPPPAAAYEGVPQYIAFAYIATGSAEAQAALADDLPIIRNDMLDLIEVGPARHLNFAYDAGPNFVQAVVEVRGVSGLSELLRTPPTTTEQVLFPQKYLDEEAALDVSTPAVPDGTIVRSQGTIGASMLMVATTDYLGADAAQEVVAAWAGDRYVTYEIDGGLCLSAAITLDDEASAQLLGEALAESASPWLETVSVELDGTSLTLDTCQPR